MKPFKNADNNTYGFCCTRYYFYGKHNYKCRELNGFTEDENLHYAEIDEGVGTGPTETK